MKIKQFALWVDQGLNVLVGGYADETLSARAHRCADTKKHWRVTRDIFNKMFFWQNNHCRGAFESERQRAHMPIEYRI